MNAHSLLLEGEGVSVHTGKQQALRAPVRCACPGPGHRASGQPSLPAGTALGQTLQNGLQVLLVSADLSEVPLEALDLQLLLLGLPLQQPQFPLQGPRWAQPQPQALQCPLGLVQGMGWGSMGVQ